MPDLRGRVALVTGAARGIGRVIALHLRDCGATVATTDLLGDQLPDGERISAYPGDLTDPAARAALVPAVLSAHGTLDILVNNAAYHGQRVPALQLAEADWDRVLAVNLTATAFLCQAAARHMVSRGRGSIVNVAAIQPHLPVPTYTAYAASKGGVEALTRALATELSPHGVRVNDVVPGVIATESYVESLDGQETAPAATLLGRSGTSAELAAAVAFLASDEASFVTGAQLRVDGGRSISRRPDPIERQWQGEDRRGAH